jgi:hypothetical protein
MPKKKPITRFSEKAKRGLKKAAPAMRKIEQIVKDAQILAEDQFVTKQKNLELEEERDKLKGRVSALEAELKKHTAAPEIEEKSQPPELLAEYRLASLRGGIYKVFERDKTVVFRIDLPLNGVPTPLFFPPEDALLLRALLDKLVSNAVLGYVVPPPASKKESTT